MRSAFQRAHSWWRTPTSGQRANSALATVLLAAGLSLTACSGGTVERAEPPRPTATTTAAGRSTNPATTPSPRPTDGFAAIQAVVRKRYGEYHVVVAQAGATSNVADPRLAGYATGGALADLRLEFARLRAKGQHLYGRAVPRVSAVTIGAGTATLQDCLDRSATGVMDNLGRKLDVGLGREQTTATLLLEGGVWKVAALSTVEGGGVC